MNKNFVESQETNSTNASVQGNSMTVTVSGATQDNSITPSNATK